MSANKSNSPTDWVDDDDLPEWTQDQFDRAEIRFGNHIIRPANGTLTKAGRPPLNGAPKQQVTLRLDPDVINAFRSSGPGWQSRINAALRNAVGL
jgi:uncharacterized protein (DUF4415 family)